MERQIRIQVDGIIDRLQCLNPNCEEILDIPENKGKNNRIRRIKINCTCGDTIKGMILHRGR